MSPALPRTAGRAPVHGGFVSRTVRSGVARGARAEPGWCRAARGVVRYRCLGWERLHVAGCNGKSGGVGDVAEVGPAGVAVATVPQTDQVKPLVSVRL